MTTRRSTVPAGWRGEAMLPLAAVRPNPDQPRKTFDPASLAELASAIPMLPQQQRAVKARHKDQWEGDRAIQRSIREAERRLGQARENEDSRYR